MRTWRAFLIPAPATDTTLPPQSGHARRDRGEHVGGEALETCERCGAEAKVRYRNPENGDEWLMCVHHARLHYETMKIRGWHRYILTRAARV